MTRRFNADETNSSSQTEVMVCKKCSHTGMTFDHKNVSFDGRRSHYFVHCPICDTKHVNIIVSRKLPFRLPSPQTTGKELHS